MNKEAPTILMDQDHQSGAAIHQHAEHDQQDAAAPAGGRGVVQTPVGGYLSDSRVCPIVHGFVPVS
jgi:hypothetical protein